MSLLLKRALAQRGVGRLENNELDGAASRNQKNSSDRMHRINRMLKRPNKQIFIL
jgi:hypothetical protein